MKLEDQCVPLELAKKLKDIGIEQESIFFWFKEFKDDEYLLHYINDKYDSANSYAAFTASELMELLPNRITIKDREPFNSFRLRIKKSFYAFDLPDSQIIYICNYHCDSTECTGEDAWMERNLFEHNLWDENFCNVLAKTIIKITEKGQIETNLPLISK